MKEIWRNVKNYEGLYQVSNMGNIKRLGIVNQFGFFPKEKILTPKKCKNGYLRVSLGKQNKFKEFYIHRLVAEHFIENPLLKQQVNHLNGIKNDNRVENLEWVTPKENMRHAIKHGLWKDPGVIQKYSKIGAALAKKITQKKVAMYSLNNELLELFEGVRSIENKYGFLHSSISMVCNGKRKQAYGYIWKFIEEE